MIVAIATMRMDEDTTVQVHVPMDVEIMQVPPTDKEVEKIKSVLEEETGYKFVSLDSITWDVDCEETSPMFTFHSLAPAKKLIKENMDKYIDSVITKT